MRIVKRVNRLSMFLILALVPARVVNANTYYVSVSGSDSSTGTVDHPFQTIQKAYSILIAGDTIYVRGGLFSLSATISLSNISGSDSTRRCCLFAYPGERPIFDFSTQSSSDGIKLNGNNWHLKGLECSNAAHNGIAVNGSYNIIEQCSVHDNRNTGMQLGNGASFNRVINCDSYYNFDPPLGGNADGFSPKLDVGTGNYFYGCRSWQNSDDGWDGYLRPSDSVNTRIENCWSFMNGYLRNGSPIASGNGNGFKMGGGDKVNGISNGDSLRHNMILKNCLAFDNRVKGFDQNNNRGSMTLLNCTSYRNGSYNFSISGFRRVGSTVTVANNVSFGTSGVTFLNPDVITTNSWMSPFNATTGDFASLDSTGVRGTRKPDGSLPELPFMRLAAGSSLIDAGSNVGLPFLGNAPDLGAFEFDPSTSVTGSFASSPNSYLLLQSYPNPFNPGTTIEFSVHNDGHAVVRVFNALGQEVALLFDGVARVRRVYKTHFDGTLLPSGVYFARLESAGKQYSAKLLLIK